jgi:hypothetical protein
MLLNCLLSTCNPTLMLPCRLTSSGLWFKLGGGFLATWCIPLEVFCDAKGMGVPKPLVSATVDAMLLELGLLLQGLNGMVVIRGRERLGGVMDWALDSKHVESSSNPFKREKLQVCGYEVPQERLGLLACRGTRGEGARDSWSCGEQELVESGPGRDWRSQL